MQVEFVNAKAHEEDQEHYPPVVTVGKLVSDNDVQCGVRCPKGKVNFKFDDISYCPTSYIAKREEDVKYRDILRYGDILTDDFVYDRCDEYAGCVRINTVLYDNHIYYIYRVNGELVEYRQLN